jgi:hypothetical protein
LQAMGGHCDSVQNPHPRLWRGLSRNIAGEADKRWRGTRHPNLEVWFRV